MSLLWIILGLGLLVVGGELVVRGAGRLALSVGIRPLVVGLTVVAFSTSAPELAASLTAARAGSPGLALGNVVGSNIANIGLILGICGLFRDIEVQSAFLVREVPMLVGSALLMLFLLRGDGLSRLEASLLLALMAAYMTTMIIMERAASRDVIDTQVVEAHRQDRSMVADLGIVAVGVALLVVGADRLVLGASALALSIGISERVVGLTIMAVGTSLPELASGLIAAHRGQGDLVLGNVAGSNIFNLLFVLGATGLLAPLGRADGVAQDLWVMLGFSFVLAMLLRRGRTLYRTEAALLLSAYAVYVYLLF